MSQVEKNKIVSFHYTLRDKETGEVIESSEGGWTAGDLPRRLPGDNAGS
ncbi:MAG: hypothetical protein Q9N34_02045 [Aquificota bacterium]|nr:hypothetical protein [Aquificota bacterium]